MSTLLLSKMKDATNKTLTENGAMARATTNSELLDFFSQGGAMRGKENKALDLFMRAYAEDKNLALKTMFYFRDVRGGQGQRDAFRVQLTYMANNHTEVMRKLLHLVPEYGRWDDLYSVFGTALIGEAMKIIQFELKEDFANMKKKESISLLAKWLKSENASSTETKRFAKMTRKELGYSAREYRKMLSHMRKYIDVVERKTCDRKWSEIDYAKVPSNAMMKYRKAFYKHDEEGIKKFIDDVKSGKQKINSAVLYPHEIVGKFIKGRSDLTPELGQAMWDGLPNYIGDEPENAIAVVDVSGSMNGLPMEVSIALGLYLGERATGVYKDHFITFSERPIIQKIIGSNIEEKVRFLRNSEWGYNTNIERVFDLILNTALENHLGDDDMLDKVYIISDMEFDVAMSSGFQKHELSETLFQSIRNKFDNNGYKMPEIVFWNVNARNKQFPMSMDDRGFLNVSGFSPSIFKNLVGGKFSSPRDLMLEVIDCDRYTDIHV